jgi:Family of unknown function (DUF5343)
LAATSAGQNDARLVLADELGQPPDGRVVRSHCLGTKSAAFRVPGSADPLAKVAHMAKRGTVPPYTAAADITSFFDRIKTMQPPEKIDTPWVESLKIAATQPSGVVGLVKWLGIASEAGVPDPAVWNKVRIPTTRAEALDPLVRTGYSKIFDRLDVEQATRQDLEGTFVNEYEVGDPQRKISCFLALCELAGIKVSAAGETANTTNGSGSPAAAKKSIADPKKKQQAAAKTPPPPPDPPPASSSSGVTIALNVEIPADWTEAEIRERIAVVSRAVRETGVGQA